MGYEIYVDDIVLKKVEKFTLTERNVFFNKLDFLKNNPDHPSLRTEKMFKGTKKDVRASSINMGIRIFWTLEENMIFINDVGRHDTYRKYNKGKRRRSQ